MIRVLLGLGLGLWLLATPAHASIIPVVLHFSDPNWSGFISFNDALPQAWTNDPLITTYPIVAMTISGEGHTWMEDDLIFPASSPPDGGLVVDSYGTAAFVGTATDDTGAVLSMDITVVNHRITETLLKLIVDDTTTTVTYTASVPAPATLLLLGSGLAGLGTLARGRRR